MEATVTALLERSATDLMSEVVVLLRDGTPLRQAAEELLRSEVHGAPAVDAGGRCVGVLSVSDLAWWAVYRTCPASRSLSGQTRRSETSPGGCWTPASGG